MKKRIAVWIHGGVGTGHFAQGYPMLEKLLERLSGTYQLVIYSQSPPDPNFNNAFFKIRTAPHKIKSGIIRWLYLIKYFLQDHNKLKFKLLFAFWGYPAGLLVAGLSRLVNIPSAIYLLGSDSAGIPSINFGILHKPVVSRFAKWAYRNTSMLFAISNFQKQSLMGHGVTRPIHVIPWGVDPKMYKYIPKTRGTTLRILHVGHLSPVKDQTTLLKAFAELTKFHAAELRIFGGDYLQGSIQNLCKQLGIERHVHFNDVIPYSAMPAQYEWADMMLHTSVSEGQSMALTEAAACGVLLAGTRVGLLYDLGEEYCIAVEPGDHLGLVAKINLLLNTPEAWKSKTEKARQWAEVHDIAWTTNQVKGLLQKL